MATTLILLTVHLLHLTSTLTAATNRRILHQPFFPLDSTPPSPPPPTTSPSSPFFPSYPSPPPPPLTSPASPFASFPANISSLILPHSPSSHPLPHKLISITFAVSLSAAVSAAVALFFFFRGRRRRGSAASDDKAAVNTTATTMTSNSIYRPPPSNAPPTPPPQLRKPSSNSSEFLYLGTLVNSTDVNGGGGEGGAKRRVIDPRKLNSPELQPLPPLYGRDNCQNDIEEDEREEFYSPRGWASGRESGSGGSRRIFEAVVRAQAEQLMSNNGGGNIGGVNSNDSTSCSSSSSSSGSPARSASISISPPVSNSPKNRSNPKSSPEFIEMQVNHLQQDPPVPDMSYSPSYSLSSIPSSPERGMKTIKEDDGEEAEESPLLSNASSSSRINSPPLSPLKGKIGNLSPEERDWGVLGQNSPSLPNGSTPKRSISSPIATITSFLRGGKRKDSDSMNSSISVSDSLVSSHSHPSPISSTGSSSRISRSYPCSPLSGANSQRLSSVSCGNSPRLSNVSDQKVSSPVRDTSCVAPQPPPPPPPPPTLPPPALRRSQSPPLPPAPTVSEPDVAVTPPKLVAVKKRALETPVEGSGSTDEDTAPKPKLKPLHWDKVRASSDREMVWDQLRSSSFKLNEEMIETLFVVNTPNSNQKETPQTYAQPYPNQENRLLDPKKAQNIAILLRALNVTMEEVCEALLEGNAETLGTELLESLLKMAPTKEEERKLKEYKDDSPVRLGHAEKFLKAVIDIPFAFRRVEAMLYMTNFESEVEYLKKSFASLEAACDELRSSRMFLKLLEAVLKTGNRMNIGTNRGDAQAFKLDTLLKLVDVKGTDGKTTLLHFVVQEISRTEGQRLCVSNNQSLNEEAKCRKLGLQVVSSLTADLANVKKSAAMDSDVLNNDVSKLTSGLANIAEVVRLNEQTTLQKTNTIFSESLNKFVKIAEEEIIRVQAQESVTLSLVKEITEYFHGNSAKEEAHPFRIFMVVRDFLTILDRVCKEVGMINERTFVSSAHRFPIPVNPMLPVPVNPLLPRVLPDFPSRRQSSFDDDGSP